MASGSSSGGKGRIWILPEYADDYWHLRLSDPEEYYAGLRREWVYRVNEAKVLVQHLREWGSPTVRHFAVSIQRRNHVEYEVAVRQI